MTETPRTAVTAQDVAAPYQQLGRTLDRVGDMVEDYGVEEAEKQGARAVTRDVDGQLTVKTMPSFSGKAGIAYNRVAKHSYLAQVDSEMQKKFGEKALEFEGKPEKFQEWSTNYIDEMVGRQDDPALQNAVKIAATRHGDDRYRGLVTQRHALDQKRSQEAMDSRLLTLSDEMEVIARQNGAGTDGFRTRMADFDALLNEKVNNPAIAFPREKADRLREEVLTRAHGAAILDGVERTYRTQGVDAAKQVLRESVASLGKTIKDSAKIERQGLAWLRTEDATFKGDRDIIKREWTAARPVLEQMSVEQLDDLEERAYSVGAHQVGREVRTNRVALEIARELRGLPETERAAALRTGTARLSGSLVDRIVGVESGGDPNARATTSSAEGPGQFVKDTWRGLIQRHRPDLAAGRSDAELLALRRDPVLSREMVGKLAEENRLQLRQAGVRSDDGATYLAHFLGAGDAIKVLQSPSDTPISGLVQQKSIEANQKIFDRNPTVGKIIDWATRKMGPPGANREEVNLAGSREGLLAMGMIKRNLQSDLNQRVTDLASAVKKQEFPDLAEVEALGAEVFALGNEDQKRKVAELAVIAETGQKFAQMPAAERAAQVSAWQAKLKEGASQFERNLAATMSAADGKINKAYRDDPYGAHWRYAEGAKPTGPVDFANYDQTQRVLGERVRQQATISADQGIEPFSVLRPAEADNAARMMTGGTPQQAAGALAAISAIPDQAVRNATLESKPIAEAIAGMAGSNDPVKMTAAMGTMEELWRQNPAKFKGSFGDDAIKRMQAWQSWKDTLTPAEIVERLNRAEDPSQSAARKALGETAKGELEKITVANVASAFGTSSLPFTGPSAPVDTEGVRGVDNVQGEILKADFSRHYQALREVGIPADKAKERAVERLKSEWSRSEANGGTLMRHAPEKHYPAVDGGHSWMRPQIDELIGQLRPDVKGATDRAQSAAGAAIAAANPALGGGAVAGYLAARAAQTRYTFKSLVADSLTEGEISARRPPSYQIVVRDNQTGRDELLTDPSTGRHRFAFDPTDAQAAADRSFAEQRAQRLAPPSLSDTGETLVGPGGSVANQEAGEGAQSRGPFDERKSNLSGVQKTFLSALDVAERSGAGGTALRLYNDVIQRGRTETITESDFSAEERGGLAKMIRNHAAKNESASGKIDYKDYAGSSVDSNILGGFKYKIEGDKIIIEDTYDFNVDRVDGWEDNRFVQAVSFAANPRGLAASIGRKVVPSGKGKGKGVPVRIEL